MPAEIPESMRISNWKAYFAADSLAALQFRCQLAILDELIARGECLPETRACRDELHRALEVNDALKHFE